MAGQKPNHKKNLENLNTKFDAIWNFQGPWEASWVYIEILHICAAFWGYNAHIFTHFPHFFHTHPSPTHTQSGKCRFEVITKN